MRSDTIITDVLYVVVHKYHASMRTGWRKYILLRIYISVSILYIHLFSQKDLFAEKQFRETITCSFTTKKIRSPYIRACTHMRGYCSIAGFKFGASRDASFAGFPLSLALLKDISQNARIERERERKNREQDIIDNRIGEFYSNERRDFCASLGRIRLNRDSSQSLSFNALYKWRRNAIIIFFSAEIYDFAAERVPYQSQ